MEYLPQPEQLCPQVNVILEELMTIEAAHKDTWELISTVMVLQGPIFQQLGLLSAEIDFNLGAVREQLETLRERVAELRTWGHENGRACHTAGYEEGRQSGYTEGFEDAQ